MPKYSNTGWAKYEFPPNMIEEEQKNKTMQLTKYQAAQITKDRYKIRAHQATAEGDRETELAWKEKLVNIESKAIKERVSEEFIQDFIHWLQGRSRYNTTEFDKVDYGPDGVAIGRSRIPGTPWGNKPLVNLPGVTEFLDQGVDRRSDVIKFLTKLKMRQPTNLDECWLYYKYLIRGVGIDEYGVKEVEDYAKFDYPPGPGGGITGPFHPSPPLHDATDYAAHWRGCFDVAFEDPATFLTWLGHGAPPAAFIPTADAAFRPMFPGTDRVFRAPTGTLYALYESAVPTPPDRDRVHVIDFHALDGIDRDIILTMAYTRFVLAYPGIPAPTAPAGGGGGPAPDGRPDVGGGGGADPRDRTTYGRPGGHTREHGRPGGGGGGGRPGGLGDFIRRETRAREARRGMDAVRDAYRRAAAGEGPWVDAGAAEAAGREEAMRAAEEIRRGMETRERGATMTAAQEREQERIRRELEAQRAAELRELENQREQVRRREAEQQEQQNRILQERQRLEQEQRMLQERAQQERMAREREVEYVIQLERERVLRERNELQQQALNEQARLQAERDRLAAQRAEFEAIQRARREERERMRREAEFEEYEDDMLESLERDWPEDEEEAFIEEAEEELHEREKVVYVKREAPIEEAPPTRFTNPPENFKTAITERGYTDSTPVDVKMTEQQLADDLSAITSVPPPPQPPPDPRSDPVYIHSMMAKADELLAPYLKDRKYNKEINTGFFQTTRNAIAAANPEELRLLQDTLNYARTDELMDLRKTMRAKYKFLTVTDFMNKAGVPISVQEDVLSGVDERVENFKLWAQGRLPLTEAQKGFVDVLYDHGKKAAAFMKDVDYNFEYYFIDSDKYTDEQKQNFRLAQITVQGLQNQDGKPEKEQIAYDLLTGKNDMLSKINVGTIDSEEKALRMAQWAKDETEKAANNIAALAKLLANMSGYEQDNPQRAEYVDMLSKAKDTFREHLTYLTLVNNAYEYRIAQNDKDKKEVEDKSFVAPLEQTLRKFLIEENLQKVQKKYTTDQFTNPAEFAKMNEPAKRYINEIGKNYLRDVKWGEIVPPINYLREGVVRNTMGKVLQSAVMEADISPHTDVAQMIDNMKNNGWHDDITTKFVQHLFDFRNQARHERFELGKDKPWGKAEINRFLDTKAMEMSRIYDKYAKEMQYRKYDFHIANTIKEAKAVPEHIKERNKRNYERLMKKLVPTPPPLNDILKEQLGTNVPANPIQQLRQSKEEVRKAGVEMAGVQGELVHDNRVSEVLYNLGSAMEASKKREGKKEEKPKKKDKKQDQEKREKKREDISSMVDSVIEHSEQMRDIKREMFNATRKELTYTTGKIPDQYAAEEEAAEAKMVTENNYSEQEREEAGKHISDYFKNFSIHWGGHRESWKSLMTKKGTPPDEKGLRAIDIALKQIPPVEYTGMINEATEAFQNVYTAKQQQNLKDKLGNWEAIGLKTQDLVKELIEARMKTGNIEQVKQLIYERSKDRARLQNEIIRGMDEFHENMELPKNVEELFTREPRPTAYTELRKNKEMFELSTVRTATMLGFLRLQERLRQQYPYFSDKPTDYVGLAAHYLRTEGSLKNYKKYEVVKHGDIANITNQEPTSGFAAFVADRQSAFAHGARPMEELPVYDKPELPPQETKMEETLPEVPEEKMKKAEGTILEKIHTALETETELSKKLEEDLKNVQEEEEEEKREKKRERSESRGRSRGRSVSRTRKDVKPIRSISKETTPGKKKPSGISEESRSAFDKFVKENNERVAAPKKERTPSPPKRSRSLSKRRRNEFDDDYNDPNLDWNSVRKRPGELPTAKIVKQTEEQKARDEGAPQSAFDSFVKQNEQKAKDEEPIVEKSANAFDEFVKQNQRTPARKPSPFLPKIKLPQAEGFPDGPERIPLDQLPATFGRTRSAAGNFDAGLLFLRLTRELQDIKEQQGSAKAKSDIRTLLTTLKTSEFADAHANFAQKWDDLRNYLAKGRRGPTIMNNLPKFQAMGPAEKAAMAQELRLGVYKGRDFYPSTLGMTEGYLEELRDRYDTASNFRAHNTNFLVDSDDGMVPIPPELAYTGNADFDASDSIGLALRTAKTIPSMYKAAAMYGFDTRENSPWLNWLPSQIGKYAKIQKERSWQAGLTSASNQPIVDPKVLELYNHDVESSAIDMYSILRSADTDPSTFTRPYDPALHEKDLKGTGGFRSEVTKAMEAKILKHRLCEKPRLDMYGTSKHFLEFISDRAKEHTATAPKILPKDPNSDMPFKKTYMMNSDEANVALRAKAFGDQNTNMYSAISNLIAKNKFKKNTAPPPKRPPPRQRK